MSSDKNDLTDDFERLTGNTLEDDWNESPDPDPKFGQPNPNTLMERVASTTWLWSLVESEEYLTFYGDTMEIKQ